MHTAATNKQVLEHVYAALAEGDARPLVGAMADDFAWIISGTHPWSGAWRGKDVVLRELLAPLAAQFATPYRARASRFVAEGDTVVVECRGDVATKAGDRYDNHYCMVVRLRDGKLVELVEYMDSFLCNAVVTPPATVPA